MELFKKIQKNYSENSETYSITEYLELAKKDPIIYASPAEKLLKSIGEPVSLDTRNDVRLSKIHFNKTIKVYPAFSEFYGMEDVIEAIVGFYRHSSQGLEEKKQILYLLGPPGAAKSSISEKIKQLIEENYIYVLEANGELSPINESPLGLFSEYKDLLFEEFNIPKRYIPVCMSPWAQKRLKEFNGDVNKFSVRKIKMSIQSQRGISKCEPSDENNQDVSCLVGKIDIRKLAEYPQNDPDAYGYSGALCKANQGILEFVEIFKSPLKVLNPLLSATQDGCYVGTENIGAIPFNGMILSHSNEAEWQTFCNDKKNEAFIDRIQIIRVPYCLRLDEEIKIYEKLLNHSSLSAAPCAPKTLSMLAQFTILSRIVMPENSNLYSKMRIYNGEDLKNTDPKAKSLQEYKDDAGVGEGMWGISTRFAFKVLSKVFNYDSDEISANPVHLLYVLEKEIMKLQLSKDMEEKYIALLKNYLAPKYAEFIGDEIQKAYVESYQTYGQNMFENYITYTDYWIQDQDYRDPNTGVLINVQAINEELEKMEKSAGIANPKEFRHDCLNFYLRSKAQNNGASPKWDSYEKIKNVIEKRIFSKTDDLIPIISFTAKTSKDDEKKHSDFVKRMVKKGYTDKMVRLVVEFYLRYKKSN